MMHLRRFASAVVSAFAIVVASSSGGCQALVSSDLPAFRCEGSVDAGVCPPGTYCIGTTCAQCEKSELCDGRDNDCDGIVDNGYDKDGDGVTTCGHVDPASRQLIDPDCDDNDAAVHPGVDEKCNGKDDNCDGNGNDNENGACPAGKACATKTGECIDAAIACTPTSCPIPKVCDQSTLTCVEKGAQKIGEPCKADAECEADKFCGYAAALTTDIVQKDGLCTQPCCVSADCPADFVCFGTGRGGNYCVEKGTLGRPEMGGAPGGTPCSKGAECRSGRCGAAGRCEDTCCKSAQCASGTVCRATAVTGQGTKTAYVLGCDKPEGGAKEGATCPKTLITDDCAEGVCHGGAAQDGSGAWKECVAPCCGSASCSETNVICDQSRPLNHTEVVSVCGNNQGSVSRGTKQVGEPCDNQTECIGLRCYADSSGQKYCSDSCCTDADCINGTKCRPYDVRGFFVLRCLK
jgi:hypothetical protein